MLFNPATAREYLALTYAHHWIVVAYAAYVLFVTFFAATPGWIPVLIPYLWSLVFFLVPFLIVFKISLSTVTLGQPPYEPVFGSIARHFRKDRRALRRQLRLFLLLSALLEGVPVERMDRTSSQP